MLIASLLAATFLMATRPEAVPQPIALMAFAHVISTDGAGDVACLAIDGKDASAEVLAELHRTFKNVAAASECESSIAGSKRRGSGAAAVLISVERFKTLAGQKAEIFVTVYRSGKSAHTKKVWLHRAAGTWVIDGSAVLSIS